MAISVPIFPAGKPTMHAAQANLLDEINHHSEEVFRLKSLLNSRRPVSKLPPEILSTIFLKQAEAYQQETLFRWRASRSDEEDATAHKSIYTWTSVALVSRRWREVALQCAQLWTCVVLDERVRPEHAYALLARARDLPLTVIMHALAETHCTGCVPGGGSGDNYHGMIELLEEVLPRTRKLALFVGTENCGHLFGALRHPAPLLEWLHVQGVGWYASPWSSDTRVVSLPPDIFSPGTPPLRHLSVSTIAFDWNLPLLLPTLRHLKVEGRKPAPDGPSLLAHEKLLSVLRRTTHLETLDLDNDSITTAIFLSTPVDLPHLRSIRLAFDNCRAFYLLPELRIPATTTLHLAREEKSPNSNVPLDPLLPDELKRFVAAALKGLAVSAIATRSPDPSLRKLSMSYSCRIWADAIPADGSPPALPESWDAVESRPPRLILELGLGDSLLNMVFEMLDLRHLRVVSIQNSQFTPPRWADMLQRAENVTMVDLRDAVAFGLGAALVGWVRPPSMDANAPLGWDGTPVTTSPWVGFSEVPDDTLRFSGDGGADSGGEEGVDALAVRFPRLRVLRISKVDFPLANPATRPRDKRWRYRDFVSDMFYRDDRSPYALDDKGLARSLRLRADPAHGATRLERLEFWDCQCYERGRLRPLLDAVPEMWWDGRKLTGADLPGGTSGTT